MKTGHFTIDDFGGIIQRLNREYIWWWILSNSKLAMSNNKTDTRSSPQIIGSLPDVHKQITDQEVVKQFYIYNLTKKGVIWRRDIEWAATSRPPGRQPSKTPSATLLDITGRATLPACDMAGLVIQAMKVFQRPTSY
ncbi:hypothetical protein C8A01DRAFT_31664 [Parachaetomium inaequale]|uniref:Uncharacterized protein n=1 Tax=Parachaetomium inaequale TaxID=2588326 RepID=A0AAN6PNL0_9PEZI|nr:hypothetical protein C8A01DRAFT_31664 [Parachaetomium inaequale]